MFVSVKQAQLILGGTFLGMGLGTMFLPSMVLELCVNPAYCSNTSGERFLVRAFGSQASLQGLLLLTCKMERKTWLWWGLAILPFVAFDVLCSPLGPAPTLSWLGAAGDALGNAVFLSCCAYGYSNTPESTQK